MSNTKENNKNWFVALLLSIVCLDRLYLGQMRLGIVKLAAFPIVFLTLVSSVFGILSSGPTVSFFIYSINIPFLSGSNWAFSLFLSSIAFCYLAFWYVYDIVRIVTHRENLSRVMTSSKAKSNKSISQKSMSNTEENNKAWPLALFLSIFCFDRLYLGQTISGMIKFITYGFLIFFYPLFQGISNFHIHVFFLFLFWTWYVYDIVRIVFYRKKLYRAIKSGKVK